MVETTVPSRTRALSACALTDVVVSMVALGLPPRPASMPEILNPTSSKPPRGHLSHTHWLHRELPPKIVGKSAQDGSIGPLARWKCGPTGLRLSGLERINCRPTRAPRGPYGERSCRPPLPCLAAFTVLVTGAASSF